MVYDTITIQEIPSTYKGYNIGRLTSIPQDFYNCKHRVPFPTHATFKIILHLLKKLKTENKTKLNS